MPANTKLDLQTPSKPATKLVYGDISQPRTNTTREWRRKGQTKEREEKLRLTSLLAKISTTFPSLRDVSGAAAGVCPTRKTVPSVPSNWVGWSENGSPLAEPLRIHQCNKSSAVVIRMSVQVFVPTLEPAKPLITPCAFCFGDQVCISHAASVKGLDILPRIWPRSHDTCNHFRLSSIKFLGDDFLGRPSANTKVKDGIHAAAEKLQGFPLVILQVLVFAITPKGSPHAFATSLPATQRNQLC